MTIYDFAYSINDCERIEFSIFDCFTDDVLSITIDDETKSDLNIDELCESEFSDYEIIGTDIWWDSEKSMIHIEFNIDTEE